MPQNYTLIFKIERYTYKNRPLGYKLSLELKPKHEFLYKNNRTFASKGIHRIEQEGY